MSVSVGQSDSRIYKWHFRQLYLRYLLPVGAAVVLFWFGEFAVVVAHGELIDADPAPGATLETTPEELRLTFSELNNAESRVDLYNIGFQKIDGVRTIVNPEKPEQLIVTVPPLTKGRYTVQWVVSSQDGHELRGSYTFVTLSERKPGLLGTWGWILLISLFFGLFRLLKKVRNPLTLHAKADRP